LETLCLNGSKLLFTEIGDVASSGTLSARAGVLLARSSLVGKMGITEKNRKFSKFFRFLKNPCAAIFEAVPKLFGHPSDPAWECRLPKSQVPSSHHHRENRPYVPGYISGHRQKWRIAISGLLISVGRSMQVCPLVQRELTLEHGKLVKFWFSDFARTPAIQFEPIYTYI